MDDGNLADKFSCRAGSCGWSLKPDISNPASETLWWIMASCLVSPPRLRPQERAWSRPASGGWTGS